jgi:hypothetical protein
MRVWIGEEEWWPVYEIELDGENSIFYSTEVPDADVERWQRVFAEFAGVQKELKSAAERADAEAREVKT